MSKKLIVLLAVLVMGLLLAACGGGGGGEATAPEPVSLAFAGLDEFRYDPETASVAAGAPVTVTFNNEGALEHDWMLVAEGTDLSALTAEDALLPEAHSGVIAAGESNTFSFTAPAAGTYQIVCTVPGHAPAGMVGTFTVTP
ncbi:MAG: cupredoxin domain-containing protein [Anaerolineales bacterium]|uniref:plastocyanin/azurin family copper-binding protein n=1 Tax=Promineifilum sp. TaxID=2664178 RepID=UPI001D7E17FF|nr:cupredoxin domain-containing protein [Anaerolineales bacterium]MCB8935579.1 cupredoxin domain-containing protein [Promineifilum sp.]MCO5180624.1 plastocyanin/azurin family copper-binding protein [Promineifilum sp.]